jgi:DNA-binding LytR/AlgR family response regulator
MKYKCLLVDDEPLALNVLETYINVIPTLELVGKCANAFEALKFLQQSHVDILFLDINMPQLKGTDFLRSLRNPPKVILTTAFKEYALEGYDLDAVDYLLKPISLERFVKAVNKIGANIIASTNIESNGPLSNNSFLYFRIDRKMVKVFLNDVLYIESEKDYVKIVRQNKLAPLMVKQTISSLEEMLPRNHFVRIHRSFIVSVDKIKSFNHQDVDLDGHEIPVGRGYQDNLKLLMRKER